MQYNDILDNLKAEARFRRILGAAPSGRIDLLSNDYLGPAAEADRLRPEFEARFSSPALTSAASRLLSRRQDYHTLLEQRLAELYGRPALLFNSGYHANTGLIPALAIKGSLIVADRLIHASSIDGIRLADCDFTRFPHNDVAALRRLLERRAAQYDRVILLLESIYSMDGDLAPLREIVALKQAFPNLLICLDEAHGFGVRGPKGLGLAEESGLIDSIDVIIGTLGKAAASSGAFVVADDVIIDLLINTARSFIFSTAIPPICSAWSLFMIEKIIGMTDRREQLKRLSADFREALEEATGQKSPSASQIVPYIVGDAQKAVALAQALRDKGFDSLPIRRPTVPPGGERLRFSLSAPQTLESLLPLIEAIAKSPAKP